MIAYQRGYLDPGTNEWYPSSVGEYMIVPAVTTEDRAVPPGEDPLDWAVSAVLREAMPLASEALATRHASPALDEMLGIDPNSPDDMAANVLNAIKPVIRRLAAHHVTTTEWGVQYAHDGYTHRAKDEANARYLATGPDEPRRTLVTRQVTPWVVVDDE